MVNLNQYRPQPTYPDGRETTLSSREVEQRYLAGAVPELFKRACHPLVAVDPIVSMGGEGDFDRTAWDRVAFVRYRSRRDFLEFLLNAQWQEDVEHKWASLERSHTLPAVPQIWMVGVRLVPFLFLVCIGLLLDRVIAGRQR